jgi:hypothetical protein
MKKGICKFSGCGNEVYGYGARGADGSITQYCRRHYQWLKYRGTLGVPRALKGTLAERFWAKVDRSNFDGCWIWTGPKTSKGYGAISGEQPAKGVRGKTLLAHRVSYELNSGDTLTGSDVVCHSCDTPDCVNPAHLRKDTQSSNIKEAFAKERKEPLILSGENNPKSKLTLEQARYIKAHPEKKHTELAAMFGLSPNCIRGVRIGRTWKEA